MTAEAHFTGGPLDGRSESVPADAKGIPDFIMDGIRVDHVSGLVFAGSYVRRLEPSQDRDGNTFWNYTYSEG